MNPLPEDMENALTGSQNSHASLRDVHSINPTHLMARIESYEGREKKGISDVRRTFCLFVTFDLLFVTLLWIIELNVSVFFPWLYKNCFQKQNIIFPFFLSFSLFSFALTLALGSRLSLSLSLIISDSFSEFYFLSKWGSIGLQLIWTSLVLYCHFLKQTWLKLTLGFWNVNSWCFTL